MRAFTFGDTTEPPIEDAHLRLGRKGAGLVEMARLGIPVPPGFILPADACLAYFARGEALLDAISIEVERGLAFIESERGERFGDGEAPLLVSVRSGAAVSMPGMMDTVLDVGFTPETLEVLARRTGDRRFAVDTWRRFIENFAPVVLEVDADALVQVRRDVVDEYRAVGVPATAVEVQSALVTAYLDLVQRHTGRPFPLDPRAQLREAIAGVFRSWNTRRAVQFRAQNGIADGLGTAVTIQAMVFGNRDERSCTGVAVTRCPNTGEKRLFGEYLPNAQGEDVVRGTVTPLPIEARDAGAGQRSLEDAMPEAFAALAEVASRLERHYRDVQDVEFTVESGRLWMLQTRDAKRSARAAVRIAVEMADEGLISRDEALCRVEPARLSRLLHPSVDLQARRRVIGRGLPASPGAVSGAAFFDPEEVVRRAEAGERVILVRVETSTEDLAAMRAAIGVLTARGGMTSHAALVARGMGRCAVTGCADIEVDERRGRLLVRNQGLTIEAGTMLTLDGTTGEVILGEAATSPADPPPSFQTLMGWADARRRLAVRGNADTVADAEACLEHGAEGIGLCRTEHMFLEADRVSSVREMILADDDRARRAALDAILPIQREDFRRIFSVMRGEPVAIRLLDLPLHEFLTDVPAELADVADRLRTPLDVLVYKVRTLRPENPMLAHRGCRLGLTFPEVYEVQVRAIIEAALDVGPVGELQIVVPMVVAAEEMARLRRRIRNHAGRVCEERGAPPPAFTVGAMIEVPRACLIADQLAAVADFFLFGTNDLTMTTFGTHRDDASRFLPFYLDNEILAADPFARLDRDGVGALVGLAVERGRRARPDLVCGLTGAQMGDPASIELCHELNIDYVSCPPHHVPVARLAAARAAIRTSTPGCTA
jgi:pyruvate,orthophosphate dikinase